MRSVPNEDAARDTTDDATDGAPPPGATDVRVRVLRGEAEIPRICALCAAVFKEVAVPLPDELENDPIMLQVGDFLESRYETAMIKDLNSVITRNMREKRRAANQAHAEFGRVKARATARELQTLQRTRTSVDALTTEQLTEMRARISDEIEAAREELARTPRSPEEIKRARARQWIQLVADGAVEGGVSTGLVSARSSGEKNGEAKKPKGKFLRVDGAPLGDSETSPSLPPTKDGKKRELIASATLQVCVPDSALPPPFPSSKPYRSYLANVAVAPEARRSGVATAIIAYSERLTKLWGFDEMWLHVNIDNPGARALYEGLGYAIVSEDPWFYLDRRYLMRKTLP
jgi:hypothetical protein